MGNSESLSEKRGCPACASTEARDRGEKNGYEILACRSCGTLYTSRVPPPLSESAYDYESYYTEENLTAPDFVLKRLDEIIAEFAPYKKNNRLLDVGFGSGVVMQTAARAGWTAMGQEISGTAVAHARSLGFEVFRGELVDAKYESDSFDVVTCSEVFEHVPDPQELAFEMARILRPGGLLWATTPHGKSISERLLKLEWSLNCPPEHLQLFSIKGMKKLLTEAGFRRVKVFTEVVNPFEILHKLRKPQKNSGGEKSVEAEENGEGFNRTQSSYQLNEFLTKSPGRTALKNIANRMIRITRLGDDLKIWAEK
jgi:2-polyprenyl-3-methyl-5-hydroxy-6-metoxy-1,4-benzoquinol methylase